MNDLKFEFDSTARTLTYEGNGEHIKPIKLIHPYEYNDFCEIILSPSQYERHICLMNDGVYKVSKKRYLAAIEWLKSSYWRVNKHK
jgi:hypothetical protein